MKKRIAVVYGAGGVIFDPPAGERHMVTRLKAIGVDVGDSPYGYTNSLAIHNFLMGADWRGLIGDSFGATFIGTYASGLPQLDYAAGFQPSVYATIVREGNKIYLPSNIKYAHDIRDPWWIDTAGLGYAEWVATDPKKTTVLTTEHRGAHPDDWGVSQDLIFDEVKRMMGAIA